MAAEESAAKDGAGKSETADGGSGAHLSLKDVERELGISYPTLLRYKNEHGDRIPSEGKGRSQRYPREALEVFRAIYAENTGNQPAAAAPAKKKRKPGRRKAAAKKKKAAPKTTEGLLTLKDVQRETKISYPTLRKYVKEHDAEIPSEGKGRRKRFPPEAVEVFRAIRERKGSGGRPPKGAASGRAGKGRRKAAAGSSAAPAAALPATAARRLERMEKSLEKLVRQVASLEKELKKPLKLVR